LLENVLAPLSRTRIPVNTTIFQSIGLEENQRSCRRPNQTHETAMRPVLSQWLWAVGEGMKTIDRNAGRELCERGQVYEATS